MRLVSFGIFFCVFWNLFFFGEMGVFGRVGVGVWVEEEEGSGDEFWGESLF